MRVSLIQMNSAENKERNLDVAEEMIRKAVGVEKPDLVVLPEYFAFLGEGREAVHGNGEAFPEGPTYRRFSALASELGVTLHLGSMVEKAGNGHYNTTLVFGPDGAEIARYRKMHLFDIDVPGGMSYRESDTISRGEGGRDLPGGRDHGRLRHLLRHPLPGTLPRCATRGRR